MGRPVVRNTFDVDRWDYVYTFEGRDGTRDRKSVSLGFEDGALTSIAGSFLPEDVATEAEFRPTEKCAPKVVDVEKLEEFLEVAEGDLDPLTEATADEQPFDDPFSQQTVFEEEAAIETEAQ